jgi:hypothetical protein
MEKIEMSENIKTINERLRLIDDIKFVFKWYRMSDKNGKLEDGLLISTNAKDGCCRFVAFDNISNETLEAIIIDKVGVYVPQILENGSLTFDTKTKQGDIIQPTYFRQKKDFNLS